MQTDEFREEKIEAGRPAPCDAARSAMPFPEKRRRTGRKILIALLTAVALYAAYTLAYVYLWPDGRMQQIYLVPHDASIIIQSSEPIADWQRLSNSEPWKRLRESKMFAEIVCRADMLDTVVRDNKTLLSLIGRRDMIISVHRTHVDDWDFLMLIDLQKASKLGVLKSQLENIFAIAGSTTTQRKYKGVRITEIHYPETRDILYMAFIENHAAASYTARLVEAAIDERSSPGIGLDDSFIRADKLLAGKGLCRVFVNYEYLPQLARIYLSERQYFDDFCASMDFAGLWLGVDDRKVEVNGWTLMRDSAPPLMQALLGSGARKMGAHKIMSARTALYVNVGFENPAAFIRELENAFARMDKAAYDKMMSIRQLVEKYFDISVEQNLLSWMAGEYAFAQSEPGLLGQKPEMVFAVKATDAKDARDNIELLRKKMSYRSPVKFRRVDYKNYEINYVEVKSLFKMLFPNLAQSFDGIYYTFVEDYVMLSNTSASLLSAIEDIEQRNVMEGSQGFRDSYARVNPNSTVFAYADMQKLYPQLRGYLTPHAWSDIQADREVLYSFPHWVFQIAGAGRESSVQLISDYLPYVPEPAHDLEDDALEAESEKELMNELKRFHVEKFEGNVLREFYPDGGLLSESETRDGRRNGRYREYYENGALRLRGRYSDDQPRGVWKYYTDDGRFDRKEKHR